MLLLYSSTSYSGQKLDVESGKKFRFFAIEAIEMFVSKIFMIINYLLIEIP